MKISIHNQLPHSPSVGNLYLFFIYSSAYLFFICSAAHMRFELIGQLICSTVHQITCFPFVNQHNCSSSVHQPTYLLISSLALPQIICSPALYCLISSTVFHLLIRSRFPHSLISSPAPQILISSSAPDPSLLIDLHILYLSNSPAVHLVISSPALCLFICSPVFSIVNQPSWHLFFILFCFETPTKKLK